MHPKKLKLLVPMVYTVTFWDIHTSAKASVSGISMCPSFFRKEGALSGEEKFGARTLASGGLLVVGQSSNAVSRRCFKLVRLLIGFPLMRPIPVLEVLFCFTWLFLFLPLRKTNLPILKYFCGLLTPHRCRILCKNCTSLAVPLYFVFQWLRKLIR